MNEVKVTEHDLMSFMSPSSLIGALAYFVVFVVFGRVDVSWLMPPTTQIARAILDVWPRMPFFAVQKESVTGSNGREIYYTVPTRQFTPQELKRMGVTNGVAHPAEPR